MSVYISERFQTDAQYEHQLLEASSHSLIGLQTPVALHLFEPTHLAVRPPEKPVLQGLLQVCPTTAGVLQLPHPVVLEMLAGTLLQTASDPSNGTHTVADHTVCWRGIQTDWLQLRSNLWAMMNGHKEKPSWRATATMLAERSRV